MHQVVTTGVERTSFVFFFYPSFDATLPVDRAATASVQATPARDGERALHGRKHLFIVSIMCSVTFETRAMRYGSYSR